MINYNGQTPNTLDYKNLATSRASYSNKHFLGGADGSGYNYKPSGGFIDPYSFGYGEGDGGAYSVPGVSQNQGTAPGTGFVQAKLIEYLISLLA